MRNKKVEPYCVGCIYYRHTYGDGTPLVCHYNLDNCEPRGCPFGDGCDRRVTHDELAEEFGDYI